MFRRFFFGALVVSASLTQNAEAQSLRGSRNSVDLMYRQARSHGLHFYEDGPGVRKAAAGGKLVPLRSNANYQLGSVSHPYALATTEQFVNRLGAQYRAACGETLVVTSAVRPKSQRLANSVAKSVHPTGMAIDLRKPNKARCLTWLRKTLSQLDGAGAIEATEERNPPHFHVAVFPRPYQQYVGNGGELKLAADTPLPDEPEAKAGTQKAGKTSTKGSKPTVAKRGGGNGRTYKVRRGDSLWTISRKTQVSVDRIKNANNMRSSKIKAGQVLRIPAAD